MNARLSQRVAESRVAEVFRGELDGRPVAVKRLKAGYIGDPALAARFERESDIASRIRHPNLTRLLCVERDRAGRVSLVSEWIEGADLRAVIEANPRSIELAVHVCAAMCRGLDHLHGQGIVHRDLAPRNVLVSVSSEIQGKGPCFGHAW